MAESTVAMPDTDQMTQAVAITFFDRIRIARARQRFIEQKQVDRQVVRVSNVLEREFLEPCLVVADNFKKFAVDLQ